MMRSMVMSRTTIEERMREKVILKKPTILGCLLRLLDQVWMMGRQIVAVGQETTTDLKGVLKGSICINWCKNSCLRNTGSDGERKLTDITALREWCTNQVDLAHEVTLKTKQLYYKPSKWSKKSLKTSLARSKLKTWISKRRLILLCFYDSIMTQWQKHTMIWSDLVKNSSLKHWNVCRKLKNYRTESIRYTESNVKLLSSKVSLMTESKYKCSSKIILQWVLQQINSMLQQWMCSCKNSSLWWPPSNNHHSA